jgi:tetratricopeptide (TPR) repeat protein
MLRQGAVLEKLGRPQDALLLYSRAIDGSAERDVIYRRIGNIRYNWGQYGRALANFQVALDLNPGNDLAYLDIGLAQRKLGNNPAAIAAFKEYLRRVPVAPDRAEIEAWIRKHGG